MRYFSCSTDWPWGRDAVGEPGHVQPLRGEANGPLLEDLMQRRNFAAIWEYPPKWDKDVRYLTHMRAVQAGDLIFMFRARTGVIGVGRANGPVKGPFRPGDARRIRSDKWGAAEWRVPVKWIRWQPRDPCEGFGSPWAFYEVTHRRPLVAVLNHFGLEC
jgi:hypothetical protein